jgi:hypothetical protein
MISFLQWDCGSPCEELANYLCDCEENEYLKDECKRNASMAMQKNEPSDDQEDRCDDVLKRWKSGECNCKVLKVEEQTQRVECGTINVIFIE